MKLNDKEINNILLRGNYVTPEDLKKAEDFAKKNRSSVVEYLTSNELITKDILGQAIAEFFGVLYADLNSNQPSREQVLKIPEAIATKYRVVLFSENNKEVIVSTDNPKQVGLVQQVKSIFKLTKITVAYSLPEDINDSLAYYRKALETRFSKIIESQNKIAPEIIGEIIGDALTYRASDIHFEPQGENIVIRFRIDGVLREAGNIPKQYHENILNRIKVQANLRIDEHFSAQDGAIRFIYNKDVIDMRVSIIPTVGGEKIAIRLLSEYIRGFTLQDIGFSPNNQKIINTSARKPFGMIIVTGPTGSGKTTTLYALLKTLNRPEVNITTIEDPVEYTIIGANQIQVNPGKEITFAKGLRSIVRQDPDIILVGEIRDNETAEISVNAALTGHLLFSTFHANDAATTIPRLLDMGVESFLLASTLELVVAQRLVRKLCESCRYSFTQKLSEIEKVLPGAKRHFPEETTTLYKTRGCNACSGIGFKGRTAIFELIPITVEMKELILKNPSAQQVWELAYKQGASPLFNDGIEKVKNGLTTLEELMRVASPPQKGLRENVYDTEKETI